MANYDCEIEKYIVYYGENSQISFNDVENAIEFASKKMNEGIETTIKQINVLVGWY